MWWHFISVVNLVSKSFQCQQPQITSPMIARDSSIATISSMCTLIVWFPLCKFWNFYRLIQYTWSSVHTHSTYRVSHNLNVVSHPITFARTDMEIANNNQLKINWSCMITNGSSNYSLVMYSSNSFPLRMIVRMMVNYIRQLSSCCDLV